MKKSDTCFEFGALKPSNISTHYVKMLLKVQSITEKYENYRENKKCIIAVHLF